MRYRLVAPAASFLAQDRRPSNLAPVALEDLSPLHRALVLTDGAVTTLIQALTMEPVSVELLQQEEVVLEERNVWLELDGGGAVVRRHVILRGTKTGTAYVDAASLLVPDRLPEGFLSMLEICPAGLGAALVASRIESRRELLWFGADSDEDRLPELRSCHHIVRSYRIIAHSRAMVLVNERFPVGDDDHICLGRR